jgi:hypothetical protein
MIPCSTCNHPAPHVDPHTMHALCAVHRTPEADTLTRGHRQFWRHTLELVAESGPFAVYLLRPPDGGLMGSVHIAFLPPDVIAIYGDAAPGRRSLDFRGAFAASQAETTALEVPGLTSDRGYGPGWFAGALSRSYLCEKFLAKVFRPDLAAECLRSTAAEREEGETEGRGLLSPADLRERAEEIAGIDPRSEWELTEWQAALHRDDRHAGDILEGAYGYDRDNGDQLCGIQARFRVGWAALQGARG